MPTNTSLREVTQPGQSLLSDQLETNLASFFRWGLVNVGGFLNVNLGTNESGCYPADMSVLSPANDERYEDGQVWQGFRQDWVWETGVECDRQPIRVSGVYVDGTFHSVASTGTYAHTVDYTHGRVIFDTALPTGSEVRCEHSFTLYHFSTADTPFYQTIQANSYRADDPHFTQWGSGVWDILAENRIQLPHVIVETPFQATTAKGLELGSVRTVTHQMVTFHVLAEDRFTLKFLHDAISHQRAKTIVLFDKNEVLDDERFPLDAYQSLAESGLMYPDLVDQYPWKKATFINARSYPLNNKPPLYACDVELKVEVDV